MKMPAMPDWLLYGLVPLAVVALVFATPLWPMPIRQVVLSPQGCAAAVLLHIPTTDSPGGGACLVAQAGMRKDSNEVLLADGNRLALSVVVGWSK